MNLRSSDKLTFTDAIEIMSSLANPLGIEEISNAQGAGRVLAFPISAQINSPRQRVAAMDGFAIVDRDLSQGQKRFRIAGSSFAGHALQHAPDVNEVFRVTTGASLPETTDRVIPFELVEDDGENITIVGEPPANRHVREIGSGFEKDQLLLPAGTELDALRLHLVTASDQPSLVVFRRPRVHLITNGDEIVPPGLAHHTRIGVPDALTLPLQSFISDWGGRLVKCSLMGDNVDLLRAMAMLATTDGDVLVIAGGASNGERDLVRPALNSIGLNTHFVGVAIKPGKPVWYGKLEGLHVLGLPGNPAAAITVARLFLKPLILALSGRPFLSAFAWHHMRLSARASSSPDRDQFLFGRRSGTSDVIEILPRQSASSHLPLATADSIVWLETGRRDLETGAIVRVLNF